MALDVFNPYLFVSAGEQSNKFLTPSYAGGIASFQAQRAQALSKLLVQIDPVQDLNGQPAPYPPGGGKNLFNLDEVIAFNANVTVTKTADSFTVSNSNTYAVGIFRDTGGDIVFPVTNGQYTISIGQAITESIVVYASTNGTDFSWFDGGITAGNTSKTFTVSGQTHVRFLCTCPTSGTLTIKQFQFEKSASKTAYAPYSNICPISGRTGLTVTVQGDDITNTYPISWQTEAGTIYGGTLDVVSGVLTVDKGFYTITDADSPTLFQAGTNANRVGVSVTGSKTSPTVADRLNIISNIAKADVSILTAGQQGLGQCILYSGTGATNSIALFGVPTTEDTAAKAIQWLVAQGCTFVYPLATPETYQLDPEDIMTLPGYNQIYTDAGPVLDVEF